MNIDNIADELVKKYEKCDWKKFDLYLFMRQVASISIAYSKFRLKR